jgi:hypothetical protein
VIAPRLPDKHVDIEIYITLAGPLAHRRFAPRSKWLTSDLAIVEKMICGKGRSTPASKEKYAATYCRPSRTNRQLFLDRYQSRGEGAAQTRDANRR